MDKRYRKFNFEGIMDTANYCKNTHFADIKKSELVIVRTFNLK